MCPLASDNSDSRSGASSDSASYLPFEIHITVAVTDIERFKTHCEILGVKPVLLDLQDSQGSTAMQDLMTSSTMKGSLDEAKILAQKYANYFLVNHFDVKRIKIETVPWHPQADDPQEGQYFETHFAVKCWAGYGSTEDFDKLGKVARVLGAHRSQNVFKKLRGATTYHITNSKLPHTYDYNIVMMTYRRHCSKEEFLASVETITLLLAGVGLHTEKVISEFAIFDTNVNHDAAWIKA